MWMRLWLRLRLRREEDGCGRVLTGEAAPPARRGLALLILGGSQYNRKIAGEGRRVRGEGGRTCASPAARPWRVGEPRRVHRAPRRGSRAGLVQTNWRVCRTWLGVWVVDAAAVGDEECDGNGQKHQDARAGARAQQRGGWLARAVEAKPDIRQRHVCFCQTCTSLCSRHCRDDFWLGHTRVRREY